MSLHWIVPVGVSAAAFAAIAVATQPPEGADEVEVPVVAPAAATATPVRGPAPATTPVAPAAAPVPAIQSTPPADPAGVQHVSGDEPGQAYAFVEDEGLQRRVAAPEAPQSAMNPFAGGGWAGGRE